VRIVITSSALVLGGVGGWGEWFQILEVFSVFFWYSHSMHSVFTPLYTTIPDVLHSFEPHLTPYSQTVYNTKGTRAHTHRKLIREWLWEPKGSSLEYI